MVENLSIVAASAEDADELATLRVDAMRPSLELAGRFDSDRARQRFLDGFNCDCTWKLIIDRQLIGFYVWQQGDSFIWLDHLYIRADFQGRGIASHVIRKLKQRAALQSGCIRLMALKGSAANDFYLRHGFVVVEQQPLDNIYQWRVND